MNDKESRLLPSSVVCDIIRKYNIRSEMDVVPLVAEIKEAQDTKSVRARDKEWFGWLEKRNLALKGIYIEEKHRKALKEGIDVQ